MVTGTGIFLLLSPCGLFPVSPCLLSLLTGSGPFFLDRHSQSAPYMGAEEEFLVGVLVCPHGLFFCFMQAETLVYLELAV